MDRSARDQPKRRRAAGGGTATIARRAFARASLAGRGVTSECARGGAPRGGGEVWLYALISVVSMSTKAFESMTRTAAAGWPVRRLSVVH